MGRWSTLRLEGSNNKILHIICAYRVCQSDSQLHTSKNTSQAQQRRIMQANGIHDARPRFQFLKDLSEVLATWRSRNESYILLLDANNTNEDNPTSDWNRFLTTNNLFDVHDCRHGLSEAPPTYNRGKTKIDHILCSPDLVPSIRKCGILPFKHGPVINSDHRALFCDFDSTYIFGGKELRAAPSHPQRHLHSKDLPTKLRYLKHLGKQCFDKNIVDRIDTLANQPLLTAFDFMEIDSLDQDITSAMLAAEQTCCV